jgi:hypothetical protein
MRMFFHRKIPEDQTRNVMNKTASIQAGSFALNSCFYLLVSVSNSFHLLEIILY